MFSEFNINTKQNSRAAIIYNDLLKFKGLDKKYIQYSTYDMYIHEYNSFHTYPEVYGWFVKNNFSDIELEEIPVCVRGIKSSRGSGKEKKSA